MTIYLITFDYLDLQLNKEVYSIMEVFYTTKPTREQFDLWVKTLQKITGDNNVKVKIRKRTLKWLGGSNETLTCSLNPENGYFHLYPHETTKPHRKHTLKILTKDENG